MASETFTASEYRVFDFSSRNSSTDFKSVILLREGGSGVRLCWILFMDDNSVLPAAEGAGGSFIFYYHHKQLEHIVDMLRNEKPIYVNFLGGDFSHIGTREPVGEGESLFLQELQRRSTG